MSPVTPDHEETREEQVQRVKLEVHSRSGRFSANKKLRRESLLNLSTQKIERNLVVTLLRVLLRKAQEEKKVRQIFEEMLVDDLQGLRPQDLEAGIIKLQEALGPAAAAARVYPNELVTPQVATSMLVAKMDRNGDGSVNFDEFLLFAEDSQRLPQREAASRRVRTPHAARAGVAHLGGAGAARRVLGAAARAIRREHDGHDLREEQDGRAHNAHGAARRLRRAQRRAQPRGHRLPLLRRRRRRGGRRGATRPARPRRRGGSRGKPAVHVDFKSFVNTVVPHAGGTASSGACART